MNRFLIKGFRHFICGRVLAVAAIAVIMVSVCAEPLAAASVATAVSQQKGTVKKKTTQKAKVVSKRKSGAKKGATSTAKKKQTSKPASSGLTKGKETSADVRRRQEETQKEIKLTEQQIKENEKAVKKELNELGILRGDIDVSKKKISEISGKIGRLTGDITSLETGIARNEAELKKLKEEYLKAVKKMRTAKRGSSGLAFVFASDNFNQALRRMRYLRQFSEWKSRQSEAIDGKNAELRSQRDRLAKAREEQTGALRLQESEQAKLNQQYQRQDALVAGLKANGTALKTHLGKKQREANELRNRIAALIAEEQLRAAEEAARKKAARKAEEERKAAAEALAAKRAAQKGENDRLASETMSKSGGKVKNNKSDGSKKSDGKDYAEARKRTPRNDVAKSAPAAKTGSSEKTASAVKGNFAAMKGKLPRPVSGSFRVTSGFGRQSLPDLPDVKYDNPGIDAETSGGASALAVYNGKVSGVYMIPGYNTVVIVNHGSYYTVYGNISGPSVKVGDTVNAGQALGRLAPSEDDNGSTSIHFEVWRNREKLNPLDWIR